MTLGTTEPHHAKALAPWTLRGRDDEIRLIRGLLERRTGAALIFSGATGMGKTRLAREAMRIAAEQGRRVLWLSASGPELLSEDNLRIAHPQLFESEVTRPSGDLPLWVIEDINELPEVVLQRLHRGVVASQFLLFATMPAGAALSAPLISLWTTGAARRMDLAPLDRTTSERLVFGVLGGRMEPATFSRLWALSQGNPLYLRELVLTGLQDGSLQEVNGSWMWEGQILPSGRLAELVETWLAAISPGQRSVLEMLTVAPDVGLSELEKAGTDLADLEALERHGFVTVVPDGRRASVSITDAVLGWVVRHSMRELASRRIARTMAQVRTDYPLRRSGDRMRLAQLLMRGGEVLAADVALAGAQEAIEQMDFTLAESLARQAQYSGGAMARLVLVEALMGLGRVQEVEDLCQTQVSAAGSLGPVDFPLGVLRALNLWWGLGLTDQAEQLLDEVSREHADPMSRAAVQAVRARMAIDGGDFAKGAQLAAEVESLGASTQAVAAVRGPLLLSRVAQGALVDANAIHLLCPASELPRIQEGRWEASFAKEELAGSMVGALVLLTEIPRCKQLTQAGLDRATALRRPFLHAAWSIMDGIVACVAGRVSVAERILRQAIDDLRNTGPEGLHHHVLHRLAHHILALVMVQSGNVQQAQECRAIAERVPAGGGIQTWTPDAQIWLLAMGNRPQDAAQLAFRQAEQFSASGALVLEALTLSQLARLGMPELVYERLETIAAQTQVEFPQELAQFARGSVHGDGALLEQVGEQWRRRGLSLLALEAFAESARAYREAGEMSFAHRLTSQCDELLRICEGAKTPIVDAMREDSVLTSRQLEIARMAADGMSSRAIANKLVISVRTVDNTLGQIYRKLGVRKRSELAGAFIDLVARTGHVSS